MDLCADLIMLHAEWNLADMLICEDILHITNWTCHCRRFLNIWNTSAKESTFIPGVVYICYGFVHDFHFNTQIAESCMLWFQSVTLVRWRAGFFLVANSCHLVTQKKGAVTCTKEFFW